MKSMEIKKKKKSVVSRRLGGEEDGWIGEE